MTRIHVIPGPNACLARASIERRWCFGCRQHVDYRIVILHDAEPSYYGPTPIYDCPRCHHDRASFPGTWVEWDVS